MPPSSSVDGAEQAANFCVAEAERLEKDAKKLRDKLIIQESTIMDRMWQNEALQGNGKNFAHGCGSTFNPFFRELELRRDAGVKSEGLCQYESISRAAFGGHVPASDLQHMAVRFLRIYQKKYEESMCEHITGDENGTGGGGDRFDALTKLKEKQKIKRLGYQGYMDALDLAVGEGVEFGQHHTLTALTEMLHLRARVVVRDAATTNRPSPSHSCPDQPIHCPTLLKRLMSWCAQVNRSPAQGLQLYQLQLTPTCDEIKGTIYLTLSGLHYTNIEVITLAPPPPRKPVAEPRPAMRHDESSALSEYELRDVLKGGHEGLVMGYTVAELYESVPEETGTLLRLVSDGNGRAEVFRIGLRDNSMEPTGVVIDEPRREKEWHRLRSKEDVRKARGKAPQHKAAELAASEKAADSVRAELQVDSPDFWNHTLSAGFSDKKGTNLALLANKVTGAMRHWRARLDKSALDAKDLDMELLQLQTAIQKLQREHFAPKKSIEPRVIVIGMEAVGKSTTVNHVMTSAMKTAEQLAAAVPQPSACAAAPVSGGASSSAAPMDVDDGKLSMSTTLSQRFPFEKSVPLDPILKIEEEILKKLAEEGIYDEDSKDILPTSATDGACTALITKIRFDPKAREITLRVRYHEQREIESVLSNAKAIRDHLIKTKASAEEDEEEGPQLTNAQGKPIEWTIEIYRACALLGISTGRGTGDEDLEAYEGAFELHPRFDQLLGRERVITIKGTDPSAMRSKLAEQLLLHTLDWSNSKLWVEEGGVTVGDESTKEFSHWATVESVEVTIPSQTADFSIWDVPGFADEQADPYRQTIYHEALGSPASMLLMCMPSKGASNGNIRKHLLEHGILLELLSDRMERRIGCLAGVQSVDWKLKDQLESGRKKEALTKAAKIATKNAMDQLKQEIQLMLNEAQSSNASDLRKERTKTTLETVCQQYAVDVKGVIPDEVTRGIEVKSMGQFINSLQRECAKDSKRRTERFLSVLLTTVLGPFCQLTKRIEQMGRLSDETRTYMKKNVPELPKLLKGVDEMVNPQADFHDTPQVRAKAFRDIVDPVVKRCTPDAVDTSWFSGEFNAWRQKGARQLGLALRSTEPHRTQLRQLVSGPLAGDLPRVLLAIHQKLDDMADDLQAPLGELATFMRKLLTDFEKPSTAAGGDTLRSQQLKALAEIIRREFKVEEQAMKEGFRTSFHEHKTGLQADIDKILQNEMLYAPGRPQKERFSVIFKSCGTNLKRKDYLKSISSKLNSDVQRALEAVITNIFKSIRDTFVHGFQNLVKSVHKVLSGATMPKNLESDEKLGIAASQHYSRFCAVVITALQQAAEKQEDLEFITKIIKDNPSLKASLEQKVSGADARAEGAEEILDGNEGIPVNEMPYAVGNLQVPIGGVNALENNDQAIASESMAESSSRVTDAELQAVDRSMIADGEHADGGGAREAPAPRPRQRLSVATPQKTEPEPGAHALLAAGFEHQEADDTAPRKKQRAAN